eukprot:TRINITY_DN2027_c0_g1_i3.p1 TRINITY_DN2027_c0_g1~~TRINITY_DN2027_c0_g1_i3.p1  ORF type:complete len:123 (+),score=40.76 TRINITY_DN2027_c0_g1_i3:55-369(+)
MLVEYKRELYEASAEDILQVVQNVPEEIKSILIIGHNPGLELFLAMMVRNGEQARMHRASLGFPTASLAVLSVGDENEEIPWKNVQKTSAYLHDFEVPKELATL